MRSHIFLLGLSLVALSTPSPAAQATVFPQACVASDDLLTADTPLEHVAAAIAGGNLNVLAIGSATTSGEQQGSTPGQSFPYRMVEDLRAQLPKTQVSLTVLGHRGLTAEAMLPLLIRALKEHRYDLVVWQTGTVEAVRGLRPDGMRSALEAGIEVIRASGGDVVLIDPQFSRFLRANADLDPYQTVMQQLATLSGVVLFRRYDLMAEWASAGQIDLERAEKPDRAKVVSLLNSCLGQALARFVLSGAALKP
ncbi:MAG TPA: SGNH/GDSL hydrolase family protein [Acetobacteraceae bacterium]